MNLTDFSRIALAATMFSCTVSVGAAPKAKAPAQEAKEVRAIIDKVNTYWQTNTPAEVNPFWDNAAYHTGNMEAYFLTGNDVYRDYSERWAEHNQ